MGNAKNTVTANIYYRTSNYFLSNEIVLERITSDTEMTMTDRGRTALLICIARARKESEADSQGDVKMTAAWQKINGGG